MTTDLKRRLQEHEHRDTLVGRAIRKYGSPVLQILAICEGGYAYDLERRAVGAFDTLAPHGYNLVNGGMGGSAGRKMSAITRQKLLEANTGRIMSLEARQKMSVAKLKLGLRPWLGRLHSEASKRKMAESQRGKWHSLETRKKISKALTGVKLGPRSAEHRANISKSKTGIKRGPMSEETKRKISEGHRRNRIRHET